MQPYVHAQASALRSGRNWEDDLPIHEFMDLAKVACPDLRHRLVLHNADLGPMLAAMAFSARKDASDIALAHVKQDLGWLPPLEVWLDLCDPARLPPLRRNSSGGEEIVNSASAYLGLEDEDTVKQVWDLLTLPEQFAPRHSALASALFMSSFGPVLARAVFGPPRAVDCGGGLTKILDFSWIAEGMIVAHIGTIYSLERVLGCFNGGEPVKA